MPTSTPPTRFTRTMTRPASTSPFTNFIAPSIAPNICDSRSSARRRSRAAAWSMSPARRSASMAICLPGMASRVKRAATSLTRSAPLATTRNCTSVTTANTTAAHHVVAAHDELAERLDDGAGVAVRQCQPGGGDVQRQPEQRRHQEQGWKRAQLERSARPERGHQQRRAGDQVEREPQVQEPGRAAAPPAPRGWTPPGRATAARGSGAPRRGLRGDAPSPGRPRRGPARC